MLPTDVTRNFLLSASAMTCHDLPFNIYSSFYCCSLVPVTPNGMGKRKGDEENRHRERGAPLLGCTIAFLSPVSIVGYK